MKHDVGQTGRLLTRKHDAARGIKHEALLSSRLFSFFISMKVTSEDFQFTLNCNNGDSHGQSEPARASDQHSRSVGERNLHLNIYDNAQKPLLLAVFSQSKQARPPAQPPSNSSPWKDSQPSSQSAFFQSRHLPKGFLFSVWQLLYEVWRAGRGAESWARRQRPEEQKRKIFTPTQRLFYCKQQCCNWIWKVSSDYTQN